MCFLRPLKRAGLSELNRFPQACAGGYRLAPAEAGLVQAFAIIFEICSAGPQTGFTGGVHAARIRVRARRPTRQPTWRSALQVLTACEKYWLAGAGQEWTVSALPREARKKEPARAKSRILK